MIQIRNTLHIIYNEKYFYLLSFDDPFGINIELQLSIFDQGIKFILH